ncbi:DUF6520 family protein [Mesonia sp. K7]|uniref:DUF6520 family protein n=1 Tax=Mesonia sp. K7 TaxID=2218606 RepID=UPI000DA8CB02|nr:DUF6520 family protein [Mesonia sp. K7]PZD76443.1 hypothetical protein DNG35_11995 [Mesonia sp. K7]
MKNQFLLPVLAMILAVGMSFTTLEANEGYVTGWIDGPNGWEQVNVDCEMGDFDCEVRFLPNPTHYQVYLTQGYSNPLKSVSEEVIDL